MRTLEKLFAEKLLKIKAIKLQPANPFTWASGWKSPFYCDNRKTLSYPSLRNFVKIEIMRDSKYLLPDNAETIKATEILAKEGFVVMPYMYPDLNVARDLQNAGAAAVMPLAAPIGTNKGLCTKEFIKILIDEIDLPIIVDAGIGCPSQACEAMEMGAAAVMANTAIATAGDIVQMAEAFKLAINAGRQAYLSGLGRVMEKGASASSPLTGFLR